MLSSFFVIGRLLKVKHILKDKYITFFQKPFQFYFRIQIKTNIEFGGMKDVP